VTPTIIGLCIAGAYLLISYVVSVYAYAKWRDGDFAMLVFVGWPGFVLIMLASGLAMFLTRPHRAAAALVQRMNTPTPIQEPGAFKRGEESAASAADREFRRRVMRQPNTTGTVKPLTIRQEFYEDLGKAVGPIAMSDTVPPLMHPQVWVDMSPEAKRKFQDAWNRRQRA
jgi:hypothetical protein